jgi:hypothetical protein
MASGGKRSDSDHEAAVDITNSIDRFHRRQEKKRATKRASI